MIGIKHSLVVVSITVSHPTQQGQLMQGAMSEANAGVQVINHLPRQWPKRIYFQNNMHTRDKQN